MILEIVIFIVLLLEIPTSLWKCHKLFLLSEINQIYIKKYFHLEIPSSKLLEVQFERRAARRLQFWSRLDFVISLKLVSSFFALSNPIRTSLCCKVPQRTPCSLNWKKKLSNLWLIFLLLLIYMLLNFLLLLTHVCMLVPIMQYR